MAPKLPACTPRDLEIILATLGFLLRRQVGSHRVYVRPGDGRRVVLPMHARDLKAGLLRIKDMGRTRAEFFTVSGGTRRQDA